MYDATPSDVPFNPISCIHSSYEYQQFSYIYSILDNYAIRYKLRTKPTWFIISLKFNCYFQQLFELQYIVILLSFSKFIYL